LSFIFYWFWLATYILLDRFKKYMPEQFILNYYQIKTPTGIKKAPACKNRPELSHDNSTPGTDTIKN
jgi:hypothetical protein